MRPSRVKAKFERDEPALIVVLHLTDPSLFEMVSMMGFDGIWMDMEHHSYGLPRGAELMRAARVGLADIVARPAKGEFTRMQRMLEAGAQGIMYPRCDDAAEATEVVRWAKFAPEGERGCDGANGDMPYLMMPLEKYVAEANRETFLVVQIESRSALDRAEEIAAVDGVDVLMFGPGDFSVLSGIPGQWDHPWIHEARQTVARAARNAGKQWGCPTFSLEDSKRLVDMGARFICCTSDFVLVKQGFEKIREDYTGLGFTFAKP
ncbi:MAG: aldolase [Pirellulales bacterium]|nr:aldolase [Pirellulales bacterium]